MDRGLDEPAPLGFGTVWLDLASAVQVAATVLPAVGCAQLPFPIPNGPGLLGVEVPCQALAGPPLWLSNLERLPISGL